jgi:hypothetical protein
MFRSISLLCAVVAAVAPVWAATPSEFYLTLLERGASEVQAGRNSEALTPLRLAAFGFVDSIEQYQTAQVYIAVANDRLAQPDAAREAVSRVLAAERVERRFASLKLPAPIRTAFETIARKFLASSDVATLLAPPPVAPPPASKVPVIVAEANGSKLTPPPVQKPADKPIEKPIEKPVEKPLETPVEKPAAKPPAPRVEEKPAQIKPAPVPAPPPQPARIDVPARLASADRALNAANLAEARRLYREILTQSSLDRMTLIRAGEGLYRARDFAGALLAFQRLGNLRVGEEPYRYYIAVALYETGEFDRARRELAAALPHIEVTPDVARYRAKIEGTIN